MKKPLPKFVICKHCGTYIRKDRRLHIQNEHNVRIRVRDWMNDERRVREHYREASPEEVRKYGIRMRSGEQEVEDNYYLVAGSNIFAPHTYPDEAELQRLVELNADKVFGEKSVYVPLKFKVESPKRARVIDGLYLDFTDPTRPVFCVVEYELREHPNEHIVNQVKDIHDAFQDKSNRADITRRVWEELTKSPEKRLKAEKLLGTREIHERIDEALRQNFKMIIVLDHFEDDDQDIFIDRFLDSHDLSTTLDILEVEAWLIEFKTFESNGELIHYCNGFLPLPSASEGTL